MKLDASFNYFIECGMRLNYFLLSDYRRGNRFLPSVRGYIALLGFTLASLPFFPNAQETNNPFRELVSFEKHEENIEYLAKSVDAAKELATDLGFPAVGELVFKVTRNSNADLSGVPEKGIVFQRNDWKSWGGMIPPIWIKDPYVVRLRDKEGVIQEIPVNGGRLDAKLNGYYRPELAYLRNKIGTRDPKWDDLVLTAFLRFRTQPQYAETSMYHAIKAGYQLDDLTDFFQIVFSMLSKEGPEASLENFLSRFEGMEIPWIYIPALHNALVVTGRIDFMQQIEEQAGGNCVFDAAVIEQFRNWRKGETKWPAESLLKRAEKKRGESITSIFESNQRFQMDPNRSRMDPRRIPDEFVPGPLVGEEFVLDTPPNVVGHIEFTAEEIPHNIHLHVITKVQSNGILYGRFPADFNITFASLYPETIFGSEKSRFYSRGRNLHFPYPYCFLDLQMGTFYSGKQVTVSTSGNGLPGYYNRYCYSLEIPFVEGAKLEGADNPGSIENLEKLIAMRTGEAEPMEIDLIRYKDEIGLYINGICYLHQPTNPEPERNIDLNFRERGAKMSVEELDIWTIKD